VIVILIDPESGEASICASLRTFDQRRSLCPLRLRENPAAGVRQTIGRVASHSASDNRFARGSAQRQLGWVKHVAPVNCGLQMAEHAEGEGPNIDAAVFLHDVRRIFLRLKEVKLAGMRAAFSFEKGKAWPNRRGAPLARSRCAQGA
jgi:hypothetical protein